MTVEIDESMFGELEVILSMLIVCDFENLLII